MSFLKKRIKPQSLPDSHWRDALPWDVDPKRFLPNYFTYMDLMEENDKRIYARSNIAYVHVPRSAGTTINTCLFTMVQNTKTFDNQVMLVNEHNIEFAQRDLQGKGVDQKIVLSGEFAFGACDFMKNRSCSYVLLMRDPYERVISSYAFCQKHDDDSSDFYCPLRTKGLSVVEWAIIEGSPVFRQLIAHPSNCGDKFENHFDFEKMIDAPTDILKTGKYPCWMKLKAFIEHQLTADQILHLAEYVANNIEYWFAAVGTLDRLDTLLQTMQDMYYMPLHNICKDVHRANNSNISNQQREIYRKELKEDPRVAEALKEDLLLYARVQEVTILQGRNHYEHFHAGNVIHHKADS